MPIAMRVDKMLQGHTAQTNRHTVGQGEPKTGQKQKYRFTKKLYFYGLNRKITYWTSCA